MLTEIQRHGIVKIVELNATRKEVFILADIELLKSKIFESGMTMTAISRKTGIVRETLYNRMSGKGDFTASEIVELTKALHLTKTDRDNIFLSN